MADARKRKARAGLITALGVGAVVAGGVAAERAFVRRDRRRRDPHASENYGELRGRAIGPVASFDGTLLNVEEAGEGDLTVVLSHGFSLGLTLWHHQIADLAHDHRLVLFDHRGHGRSGTPPSDDWSLEALGRDLDAVVRDAAGDGPVVLVGHSMGGMAVLEYCDLFPETLGSKVAGVVLVDTTAADVMGGMMGGNLRRAGAAVQMLQEATMRAIAGRPDSMDRFRMNGSTLAYLGTRLMGFGPKPSPAQVAFVEHLLSQVPSEVWGKLIPSLLSFDLNDVLPELDIPVMIVVGSHDRLTPPRAAERMAAALPNAQLVILDGAGHTSMLERHEEFNAALRRFVAAVRAPAAER